MQLEAGQVLAGRYRLVKLLGEGGMGAVWEAVHMITMKPVALKYLKPRSGDPTIKQRFFREARAASAVRHRNVVKIHDVVELEGGLFMVMDLLQGESLEALLERQPKLSVELTSTVLHSVVAAVMAAHAAGVVHRDLKPANIFLARAEEEELVLVLDFGIAKILQDVGTAPSTEGKLTETGAVMGTPHYMAPEQVWGESVDGRADVWALGVVLYECLAGRRPFEGENMGQLLKAVATQAIEPLSKIDPTLPPTLTELVTKMLQADRTQRLANLEVVLTELAKYTGRPNSARVAGETAAEAAPRSLVDPLAVTGYDMDSATRAAAVAKSAGARLETASALATEQPSFLPSRRPWAAIVGGVIALAIVAGALVMRATPAATAPSPTQSTGMEASALPAPPSAIVAASAAVPPSASAPAAPPAVASSAPVVLGVKPAAPPRGVVPRASSTPSAAPSAAPPKPSAAPNAGGLEVHAPF